MILHKRCFRFSKLLTGVAALIFVGQAHALGLGKLKVSSALDEPLVAEIELIGASKKELESLEIKLGSAQEFQQAGIPRERFLRQLEFRVSKVGKPSIRLNSTEPVNEPFLHFLINAKWAEGMLLGEYTALLDPPLYASQQPPAVSSPTVVEDTAPAVTGVTGSSDAVAAPATPAPAASSPETEPAAATPTTVSTFSGAEFGPTERGDTLWEIASSLDTRGYDVNVFQVMIALLNENPDAFVDNNINRLKTGQILRLSDMDSARSVARTDASATYQAQLEEWQSYKIALAGAGEATMVPATADGEDSKDLGSTESAGTSAAPEAESTDSPATETAPDSVGAETVTEATGTASESQATATENDLLKIVRATLEQGAEESAGSSAAEAGAGELEAKTDSELSALREQIAALEESLVSRELQNQELQERVSLLEGQVENAQRLVELESQELALAQQQAAEQLAAQMKAAEEQAALEQVALEQAALEQAAQEQAAAQAAQEQAAAQQAAQQQAAAQTTQQPAAQEQAAQPAVASPAATEMTKTAGESASEAGFVAAAMKTVGDWWTSARNVLLTSSMSLIAGLLGVVVLLAGIVMFIRRRRSIAEFEESILSGSGLDAQTETTETAASSSGTDTSFLSDFGMPGMGGMQADEVDPLAEAEVYLAYGRDEQAEEVLKEAVTRNPERHELKLKLLEIYQQRNELKSFETLAEELYPAGGQGDIATWSKVVEMGLKMNPDNPLFSEELPAAAPATAKSAEPESAEDLDLAEPASFEPLDLGTPESDEDAEVTTSTQQLSPAASESIDKEFADLAAELNIPSPGDEEELPQDIVAASSTPVDPALHAFPPPDENAGLDLELDRLAERVDANASAREKETLQPLDPSQVQSEDSVMLDFASDDISDQDFDLGLGDAEEAPVEIEEPAEEEGQIFDLNIDLSDDDESELSDLPAEAQMEFDEELAEEVLAAGANGDDAEGENGEWDEAATKLDLAQAYLNMGDKAGARSIIDEVMKEGSPAQQNQAAELAAQLS